MKILFWSDGFWPRLGGIETQSVAFIQEMQKRGHLYQVIAQQDDPSWEEKDIYKNIQIDRFDFNSIIRNRNLKIIANIRNHIEYILKNFRPDIVHVNANVGGSLFAFLFFKELFQVPIVLTAYAPHLQEGRMVPLFEKLIASVDLTCCISDWVLTEIKKRIPSAAHKLQRIYCGLAMPQMAPTPLPFSPPTLLGFGRLSWEKGFDTMIRTFALLKQKGSPAQCILAGEGPERPALERLASQLGAPVQFLGRLSKEEVVSTFNQATIVIACSLLESFGLVILEAMQMGRPVIASRIQAIPELVSHQQTGLLVAPKNPEALCHAIEILLNDPEKARKMGKKGAQKALQFTLCQMADQYERVYENFILG